MRRHRVVVLVLDGAQPLDVGIPAQTFQARDELPYDVLMCGVDPGVVRSGEGMAYLVEHGVEALAHADTVIVPGYRDPVRDVDPRALDALRAAHARGARIAAICTGVSPWQRRGLLGGRRATTHWRHASDLARLHPEVEVDGAVLFIDEGDVLTSAGVASGIDLCLHLIRADYGVRMSNVAAVGWSPRPTAAVGSRSSCHARCPIRSRPLRRDAGVGARAPG